MIKKSIASLVLISVITIRTQAVQAEPVSYSCRSLEESTQTTLAIIDRNTVQWSDPSHSASSKGVWAGIDTAPFSTRLGQLQFVLVDYKITNDEKFVLSVPENILEYPQKMHVTEFFDNDDHAEGETEFDCIRN